MCLLFRKRNNGTLIFGCSSAKYVWSLVGPVILINSGLQPTEIVCSSCSFVQYWAGLQLPENKGDAGTRRKDAERGSTAFPPAGSRSWPTGSAERWQVLGLERWHPFRETSFEVRWRRFCDCYLARVLVFL